MSLRERLRRLFGREETLPDAGEEAREEAVKAVVRRRCESFRRLLSANKGALEAMSDMEDLLRGTRPFGMGQVRSAATRATAAVYQMVRELRALSRDAWPELPVALTRITGQMEALLNHSGETVQGPLVIPLGDVRMAHAPLVGGKMASLGEVAAHAGLNVPDGFAVTVAAYERFMNHNDLRAELERRIQAADTDNLDEVFRLSSALQQCVLSAPLPPDLEEAIVTAVDAMQARAGEGLLLALRSSAVGEDAQGISFAGQFRSELQVPPEEACRVWKEIVAGKYALTAMTYRLQRGIPDHAMPMGVGVLAMVRAKAGGVAYSRDPVAGARGGGHVVINAVHGLPGGVVDGGQTPHVWLCSRENPPRVLEVSPADGPPPLDGEQAGHLARVALALEEYYNDPQDVEWALEADGRIVILQSRPLPMPCSGGGAVGAHAAANPAEDTVADTAASSASSSVADTRPVLARGGMPVSPGLAEGQAFVARKEADMLAFPEGGILVVEQAWPRWAPVLGRAAGLVSENGGMAGHLASVAREYGLPAIFSLPHACRLLDGAGLITLDADGARILAGGRLGANPAPPAPRPCLMAGSPVFLCLQEVARLVTPLHLLRPDAPEFAPEHCRSLHDITRFCHEKAVALMFRDEGDVSGRMGKQLRAGACLRYWVVDMGGGFSGNVVGPVVDLEKIASRPMLAFWEGLVAVPWAGPPEANVRGLMSAIFESAMNPELESTAANSMAERNIFIIDAEYMLLQARYGYHFCTVECLAHGRDHENFVSFQFKGGAADMQRRCIRVDLLTELLEEQGFRAEARQDALFAVAEGQDREKTLQKTALLGYVLLHSRQTDILMGDKGRVEALRRQWQADMTALTERWPRVWRKRCCANRLDC